MKFFNSYGKKMETFRPVRRGVVTIFTCGPSVYQRAHIGNFRTFLFEDVLVRYLEFTGYKVVRGMNFTDLEDKAVAEAARRRRGLKDLTDENICQFLDEMKLLRAKIPDHLPKASECIEEAAEIIGKLLDLGIAYHYRGNLYFDPLKVKHFGDLYGLDMNKWPKKKVRFHKDTYPGVQWNLGDFILWHGFKRGEKAAWDSAVGKGRPSWNIQDPAMVGKLFHETLSFYCGGIDNLYRHHDYSKAILEAIRPYPMARYWLHCHHLHVDGQKMSKSKGNIVYTDTVTKQGYNAAELRFFLIYGHYRETLDYCDGVMASVAETLRAFRKDVKAIAAKAGGAKGVKAIAAKAGGAKGVKPAGLKEVFAREMDDDLGVKAAFDALAYEIAKYRPQELSPAQAQSLMSELKEIDEVLKVIF